MTSEVIMLNKDAVVIAADSAVTTGRDPHPRYSKAANKIFDVCKHGNVAVSVYASADIDRVPWELALKQFRRADGANPQRTVLFDYVAALIQYLEANASLFPAVLREDLLVKRFRSACIDVLERASAAEPTFSDLNAAPAARAAAWANAEAALTQLFAASQYQAPLGAADHQTISVQAAMLEASIVADLANTPAYVHADPTQLTQLAIESLVKNPTDFLDYTGVVIAGYGGDDIFPSFEHIYVYGHIGDRLLWTPVHKYAISHDNAAWIQPFAQSAMIDRFTDGFDASLNRIIYSGSRQVLAGLVADLIAAGIAIPPAVGTPLVDQRHGQFMQQWRQENWSANFHPLRRVLSSLSVSEMGHLAESLLVLEALRERVTSPSESIGGPIDVAAVTKAEGLIWLKRKHFFEPQLNSRYLNRVQQA